MGNPSIEFLWVGSQWYNSRMDLIGNLILNPFQESLGSQTKTKTT
jgi:hypothetical protein